MPILLSYTAIDGHFIQRAFTSLHEAQAFATDRVGATPEVGTSYAVSADGVGCIDWEGCSASDLWPDLVEAQPADWWTLCDPATLPADDRLHALPEDNGTPEDNGPPFTTRADGTRIDTRWYACSGTVWACLDCGDEDHTGDEDWDTHDSRCSRKFHRHFNPNALS